MSSKNKLVCQACHKWFSEENLIINAQGAFCEECYHESHE